MRASRAFEEDDADAPALLPLMGVPVAPPLMPELHGLELEPLPLEPRLELRAPLADDGRYVARPPDEVRPPLPEVFLAFCRHGLPWSTAWLLRLDEPELLGRPLEGRPLL